MNSPRRNHWTKAAVCWIGCAALIAAVACSGGNDAAAQGTVRVETFTVTPDSFVLLLEAPPTVEVDGDATTYTIASDGNLLFTPQGQAEQSFALDAGDILIERPRASTLTFIREI